MAIATSAARFTGTLGINTHIDFAKYGYQNLATVESNVSYLGIKFIRDSAEIAADAQTWLQVAQATGAKFDDYIAETSPAGMQTDLGFVQQLAQEGLLASLEGGNEEDDAYPASLGNTMQITAQFQRQVFALGQQLHLPVINMSFGAGWNAANNWQGDYGSVGDLSAYTGYANAHSYPNTGQLPDDTILRMNGLASLAASTRPVMTTEIGWDTALFDQQTIAKYVLDSALDGIKDGDAGLYYYALYDDASGNWGLFNADGTARPAATALHNMNSLLADTGANAASFVPGSLNYSLSGSQAHDNSVLIEKSNGHFWLSLWNETEAANVPHTVALNLGAQATTVVEYDALSGVNSIKSWSSASSIQVSLPDHPILLEIVPAGGTSSAPPPLPPPPSGPALAVPSGETATAGSTIAVTGVVVTDGVAASSPGSLTLNVSASSGLIAMTAAGDKLPGSGTHATSVSATLAQINADLATLSYTAGSIAGTDVITIDVWDQFGLEGTRSFDVAIKAPTPTPPSPPPAAAPIVTAPATDSVAAGSTTKIGSVSVADAFAVSSPGTVVLNVGATTGLVTMTNASGTKLDGSGTHTMSVTGTLAQINADLSHLAYTAGSSAGSDSILVDLRDQAGSEASKSIAVSVKLATAPPPPPPMPVIKIDETDANPVILVSNTSINASSGDHAIFVGGTGDVLTAIGGRETVMAFQGRNAITTGAGSDTIRIAGSGNVVKAVAGVNEIDDSGSGNRIVLPQAGQGSDNIFGYVLQNSDTLDLRPLLAGTKWNGNAALIGDFVKVAAPNGADAVITVDPSGIASGAGYAVATLNSSGAVTLSSLLADSLI